MRKIFYALPAIMFGAFVIAAAAFMLSGKDPKAIDSPLVGKPVPAFAIEGMSNADITGPALVNFFASWCVPCEAEHPVIKKLSEEVNVYGIAYKDEIAKRDRFLARLGNPYARTGSDPDGAAAIAFGVYGVPSTFVVDRYGVIVYRHDGPLVEDDIPAVREWLQR